MLTLNIITTFNLLVFFCLLYFRKDNVLPNKVLALILVDPAINFISNINIISGGLQDYTFVYFIAQATGLFFAPLVYVYILLMTGRRDRLWSPVYLITIGLVLYIFYSAVDYYSLSEAGKAAYVHGVSHEPYPEQMEMLNYAFIIMQQIYFTMAAFQVYKYRKNIHDVFSNFEQTKARFVTIFIELIWILNLATITLYIVLPSTQVEYVILPLVLTIIYCCIVYFSYHYNSIFTATTYKYFEEESHNVEVLSAANHDKFVQPPDLEGLQEILRLVEQRFQNDELYTDPELTITSLAHNLKIPVKKLSLSINKLCDKNFYDYINDKRIEKSLSLLKDRSYYTIEAIGKESGFNSRSAFYRAFKKQTGKTPAEYMDNPN